MGNLILKSSAFKDGGNIPAKNTCDGDNVNPLLEIRNVPEGVKSLALIVDDPDATGGVTWVHWLVWNIEPKTQYVSEDNVPFGAVQGKNSGNHEKYDGPCPPRGNAPHRYMFKAYALDAILDLPSGSSKSDLESAMAGHILDQTVLTGLYSRR
jgi:Raf kinase inhibitor-like YbhB/YbcL family protein